MGEENKLDFKRISIFNVFHGVKNDNYEGVVNVLEEIGRRGRVEGQQEGYMEGIIAGGLFGSMVGATLMGILWWVAS